MVPFDIDLFLVAALRGSRAAASITGALIAIDSIAVLIEYSPRIARPKYSAAAWLFAGLTTLVVGGFLISQGVVYITDLPPRQAALSATALWCGLAAAFTVRAIARAERPALTLLSFILIIGFGTALAVACPL